METVFDTLAYTRRLTQAGVEHEQAEALADALRVAFSEGVATKADIHGVKADIARLEARMDALGGKLDASMRAMQRILGLVAALLVMMAARLFGAIRSRAPRPAHAASTTASTRIGRPRPECGASRPLTRAPGTRHGRRHGNRIRHPRLHAPPHAGRRRG